MDSQVLVSVFVKSIDDYISFTHELSLIATSLDTIKTDISRKFPGVDEKGYLMYYNVGKYRFLFRNSKKIDVALDVQ